MTELSESIFHLLEQWEHRAALVEIRESDVVLDGGKVSHAVDLDRRRSLLIPLAEGQTEVEDLASNGVTIRPRQLIDGTLTRRYLEVLCERAELKDLFSIVCDEILQTLRSRPDDPGPASQKVLDRWRDLLAPPSTRLLGESVLAGLLAELHFLERLIQLDSPAAVRHWLGPSGGRFDFEIGQAAAEVKATTGRERFEVEIHGLLQLDNSGGEDLYLYAEQLERVSDAGDSAPAVIQRLRDAGVGSHDLFQRLAEVGYLAADEPAYDAIRFKKLATRSFAVTEQFPRIIRSMFQDPSPLDRVTSVRYKIDLSQQESIRGALSGLDDVITKLIVLSS